MNCPPAPESMSARVSTILFSVFVSIQMGIDNLFEEIVAVITE